MHFSSSVTLWPWPLTFASKNVYSCSTSYHLSTGQICEIRGEKWQRNRRTHIVVKKKKEKTTQQQKGLPTLSADLYGIKKTNKQLHASQKGVQVLHGKYEISRWHRTYMKNEIRLRILGQHSWRPSRFNCTQMKIVYKYNLVPKFDFICFPYK